MKTLHLYNYYHLGDHIFNVNFLNKYVEEDISFNYYAGSIYFKELSNFILNKKIKLLPIENSLIPKDSYNMWINHNNYYCDNIHKYNKYYDLFYVDYFKEFCKTFNLKVLFKDNFDLLFDNQNYQICLNKHYDYLIINSVPFSNQFDYKEQDFINLCDYLFSKNKTFITTKKIKNYECTLDFNMSLVDIGNLSNYCENIIAINTSPVIATFTKQNINKTNSRFIFDRILNYSYNNKIMSFNTFTKIYNYL
jgi:hypothetical protein